MGNVPTKVFVKACGDYLVTSDDLRRGIRSIELERFQEKLKLAGVPITSRLITRAFNAETGVPVVDKMLMVVVVIYLQRWMRLT